MKEKEKEKEEKGTAVATTVASAQVANATGATTKAYNAECNGYRESLAETSRSHKEQLTEQLKSCPNHTGSRSKAVSTAYGYETADVKMGGKGSANWNKAERAELLETGKVRGAEGHHINSVAEHPDMQTDPNNIRFYHSRKEHRIKGHDGNFQTSSEGDLIDKDKMLVDTNRRRVVKNEAAGLGIAAATAATIGVGSTVYNTCREEGVSVKSVKKGLKKSAKPAAENAFIAACSYAVTRVLSHFFK